MSLIHHLALTASDIKDSFAFYDGLLKFFGYECTHKTDKVIAWTGDDFELLLYQATDNLRANKHLIYQPGFHHLALQAKNRKQIDDIYAWLQDQKATILDAPREYPEYPGDYYAVFFTDPDGLKFEIMHH